METAFAIKRAAFICRMPPHFLTVGRLARICFYSSLALGAGRIRSDLIHAPVNKELDAVNEARLIGGEE